MTITSTRTTHSQDERQALRQRLEAQGAGAPFLGYLITWQLKGVKIKVADLKALMAQYSLPDDAVTPHRTNRAIQMALQEMCARGYVRKTADTPERTTYQWLYTEVKRDQQGDDDKVEVYAECRVTFDKKAPKGTDPIRVTPPSQSAQVRALIAEYLESYVARDIVTHVIKAVLEGKGMAFMPRQEGGYLYVDAAFTPLVDGLRALVNDLADPKYTDPQDGICCFFAARQFDGPQERADYAKMAEQAMYRDRAALDRDIAELEDRLDKIQPTTVDGYLAQMMALRDRVAFWQERLGMEVTDLDGKMGTLQRRMQALRTRASANAAAPKPKRTAAIAFAEAED